MTERGGRVRVIEIGEREKEEEENDREGRG